MLTDATKNWLKKIIIFKSFVVFTFRSNKQDIT